MYNASGVLRGSIDCGHGHSGRLGRLAGGARAAARHILHDSSGGNLFRGSETSSDGMHTVKLGEFIIKTAEFVTHVNCRHPICYYASGAGKSFLLASHGRP